MTGAALRLGKREIAQRIPHAGTMCLLDEVVRWDGESIRCIARTHRDLDNPLRRAGQLGAVAGLEYAAQAMAVHGALVGAVGVRPSAGYLMSVRGLVVAAERLDGLAGDLVIDAERVGGDGASVVYRFALACEDRPLLSGRAAVLLDGDRRP